LAKKHFSRIRLEQTSPGSREFLVEAIDHGPGRLRGFNVLADTRLDDVSVEWLGASPVPKPETYAMVRARGAHCTSQA
jgi:hypothetical protein